MLKSSELPIGAGWPMGWDGVDLLIGTGMQDTGGLGCRAGKWDSGEA